MSKNTPGLWSQGFYPEAITPTSDNRIYMPGGAAAAVYSMGCGKELAGIYRE